MQTALRVVLWLLLGGWVGAWVLFAAGVAPAAFSQLPSTELAARVVGPVLAGLHRYGIAAGLVLGGLSMAMGRGRWLTGLPLILALACAISEFGVSAEIQALRAGGGAAADPGRFSTLHRLSVALFAAVGLGAVVLAVLHARVDAALARAGSRAGNLP